MDKLPVFEMVIDENPQSDVEVSFIALVDKPAIEKNFMAFKSLRLDFAIDQERRIISGPAMVPDTLIYRRDETGEYNVFFSKKTIEDIAIKFFKKDYQKNINLFHDPKLSVQGVTVFESFVSDEARGIQPMKGYEDLPQGTLFISAKVENDTVWQSIKDGKVKGFSVEGYFSKVDIVPKPVEDRVLEMLSATYNQNGHIYPNSPEMATVKEKLKNLLLGFKKEHFDDPVTPPAAIPTNPAINTPAPEVKFAEYKTKDGKVVSCDKLEMGGTMTVDGQPAMPGEYELEDGTKVTVGDGGVISAVNKPGTNPLTLADVEGAITRALAGFKPAADPALAQMQQKLDAQKLDNDKQAKTIKQLFEIVEQIAALPTEQPVQSSRQQFLQTLEETRSERISALAQNLAKLKKVS